MNFIGAEIMAAESISAENEGGENEGGEEPRVVVPEGVFQADPAASQSGGGLVIQAENMPASCSSVGKYFILYWILSILVTHLE